MVSTTRSHSPSVPRSAALGSVLALALGLGVQALARATGDDLVVAPPGQPAGPIPVVVFVAAIVVAALAHLGFTLAVARLRRARTVYLAVALAVLLVSFVSPFGAAATTATAVWLCVAHVAVAVGLVPITARALRGGR